LYHLIKIKNNIKPDIIHGQGTVTYILLSLMFRNKNIQTIHGIYKNEHAAIHFKDRTFFVSLKFFIKEKVESFYLKKIKNLIVITDEIKLLVSKESNNLKNIFKINNAIDIGFFKKTNLDKAHTNNDLVILFVAAITPRKGLHHLLEAYDKIIYKHPNLKLKIVGMWDWAPDYVLGLKEKFSQLVNAKKIEFTGSVSREQIENYFTSSQIFVLPSLAESAPMVISQAMCSGMAIISTRVGGIPEMITHEEDGFLVHPEDVQALESALNKLISSYDLREVFSKNAQIKGYNRHHPTSVAMKTYEAYKKVFLN
jgi:glycosyltransferase involved in cell wall biosynthesis